MNVYKIVALATVPRGSSRDAVLAAIVRAMRHPVLLGSGHTGLSRTGSAKVTVTFQAADDDAARTLAEDVLIMTGHAYGTRSVTLSRRNGRKFEVVR